MPKIVSIACSIFSGNPLVLYPYLTTDCHCDCEQCLVRFSYGQIEFNSLTLNQRITEFKSIGGVYVDLQGGDPTLAECCPSACRRCNELDLWSSLTTMGKGCGRIVAYAKEPTFLRLSIDGGKTTHDRNRGRGDFDSLCNGLDYIRRHRDGSTCLIFTVTTWNCDKENVTAVVEVARFYQVPLVWNWEFDLAINPNQLRLFRWATRQAGITASRGRAILVNHIANPTCRAIHDTITLSPLGELLLPCFHKRHWSIPIGHSGLAKALESPQRLELLKTDGRFDFCDNCRNWCYLSASMPRHFHDRAATWLHTLCGIQKPRDFLLQQFGRLRLLHGDHTFPRFSPIR